MTQLLRRQLLATALAVILVLLLLVLASLDGLFQAEPPEKLLFRPVQMYVPPPPPPPPPVVRGSSSNNAFSPLALLNQTDLLELDTMELDVQLKAGEFNGQGSGMGQIGEGLGVEWETFTLSEADGIPIVVSAPLFVYPKKLIDKNIKEYIVNFHIIIDEEGGTHPVRILDNDYPEYEKQLMEYARDVKFQPQLIMGVPVMVQYAWSVRFTFECIRYENC